MKLKSPNPNLSEKLKLAVVGSRTIDSFGIIDLYGLGALSMMGFEMFDVGHIISGGALGADTLAKELHKKYKKVSVWGEMKLVEHLPDWDKYGKSAGFRRNKTIVDDCEAAIVLWDTKSHGTENTMWNLDDQGKPYVIVRVLVDNRPLSQKVQKVLGIEFVTEPRWKRLYDEKIKPFKKA